MLFWYLVWEIVFVAFVVVTKLPIKVSNHNLIINHGYGRQCPEYLNCDTKKCSLSAWFVSIHFSLLFSVGTLQQSDKCALYNDIVSQTNHYRQCSIFLIAQFFGSVIKCATTASKEHLSCSRCDRVSFGCTALHYLFGQCVCGSMHCDLSFDI